MKDERDGVIGESGEGENRMSDEEEETEGERRGWQGGEKKDERRGGNR